MKKLILTVGMLLLCLIGAQAQFTLDGQFRPRTEYRNGFGSLIPDAADPGFAISTRARLNAAYQTEKYKFYLSIQDVMVWGENRQILPDDQNDSFAVFEAWAQLNLGSGWSTKLGRQVLSYDDQRILGGLDWAQQGRNHDAALIKYAKDNFILDFAFAYNQDFDNPTGFQSVGNAYNTTGFFSYKTMQMLYLKQKWESFGASVVLMNNGFQNFDDQSNADGLSNLQTLGTHLTFNKGSFGLAANAFLQTGERQGELDVKGAYLVGLDATYKASNAIGLGAGIEIISGNDGQTAGETGAFFPLYGTNHKFNGFMDYFYVGNHANSIGLFDIHASANFKLGEKSSLLAKVLNFKGEQDLPSGENALGTEVDLVFTQGFNGYSLKIGYSHMFAADGMYELKGVAEDVAAGTQNWAWAMLIIKPKFFSTAKAD
ncbi:alginate export family protein [Flagellimonas zhangzhouensis]|uniref:Alginate export n=1 Tax=Flagellimonas zhangzhouensis TaxID=1073328 RepID=A0A1H2YLY3_9FLAO|nr:alginate export family protein [Allomuricauda zhangzhouensis]SDR02330.1 Alginate export [Allomuricauda zhangzhouensis]SDX05539.1 Alginate export [Allomuricauda zhangzhouensis]